MRSMQQQLGVFGTISAFAFRHRKTKKNLCRGSRSQDLPDTDFQPAIRQLKYVRQQYTHSKTTHMSEQESTHKIITQYTKDQLQLAAMHTGKATKRYKSCCSCFRPWTESNYLSLHSRQTPGDVTPQTTAFMQFVHCCAPFQFIVAVSMLLLHNVELNNLHC